MIAHLVLFRPRPDLAAAARAGLAAAFEAAVRQIPSVRKIRVGQRVTHGRGYEALMRAHYPFVVVFEFDDLAGLLAYLDHPAHRELAERFFDAFEEALMYDFDVKDDREAIDALGRLSK